MIPRVLLVILLMASLPAMGQVPLLPSSDATNETEGTTPEPSPGDIRELSRLLRDPAVVTWLEERASALEPQNEATEDLALSEQLHDGLVELENRLALVGASLMALPAMPGIVADAWKEQIEPRNRLRLTILLIVFLFIGAGLEWLYWCYAGGARRRIELKRSEAFLPTAAAAVARLGLVTGGALLFGLGTIGSFLAFDWPPLARDIMVGILAVVVLLRVIAAVGRFVLAPRVEALRLVPLDRLEASWLFLGLMAISFALLAGNEAASKVMAFGATPEASLGLSITVSAIAAGVGIAVVWLIHGHDQKRRQNANEPPKPLVVPIAISAAILAIFGLWLVGLPRFAGTLAVLALLWPLLHAVCATIHAAFDRGQTEEGSESDYAIYRPIAERLGRFVILVIAGVALAFIWGITVSQLASPTTAPGRIFSVLIDVTVAYLIGDLVWVATRTAIDRKMASMPKLEHGQAPGPEARLATLLPVFKVIVMITVIVMVVLIALSSLGINIAPLLAGAGVVGLAIGFGAQALVRDIVAGIFFLIDDAFRVGEYIEMGELRGTVEAISIRSMRVRHHRGAVHTIPFGELKSLTNYSRDWVMMKLEFRVPFETDLKLAKKIVKQIDAELRANPDYGDSFLEPLKFQGVRRMEEFNMVVGVKFMTKPGEQWTIRRDAYQRIRDEFEKNGIHFAQRNVKVEVIGGPPLSEDVKQAAVGAAEDAIEQQLAGPQSKAS
ncbi:MAG: mechanosensitive ion channel family protein [Geminicoccaceae bacterium]